jgi:hypothetical protein
MLNPDSIDRRQPLARGCLRSIESPSEGNSEGKNIVVGLDWDESTHPLGWSKDGDGYGQKLVNLAD